ncbi:DUF4190 domain-containing protein [Blastococcus sp. SYSU DS0541]
MTYPGPTHPGADDPYRPAPAAWGQQPATHGGPPPSGGGSYGPPAFAPYGQPGPYGPPYPGPYGQPPYGGYPYAPPQCTNGMAIASLVLGILWLYWIGSILALVFGYLAKRQIQERGEAGGGMATAGIVLGWIGVGFFALFVLFGIARATGF